MKRLAKCLSCILFVIGQIQGMQAGDFDPPTPAEPNTKYAVTVSANPAEGAASLSGAGSYASGTTITISQSVSSGYIFRYWTLNGTMHSEKQSFSYTVGTQNAAFVAHYEIEPKIGVTVSSNNTAWGTVSGGGAYALGKTVQISASPNTNAGYTLDHWTKNNVYFGNDLSFNYTVESDPVEFIAYFVYTEFTPQTPNEPSTKQYITVTAFPATGAILAGEGLYSRGAEVTIKAQTIPGYRFNHWTLNGQVVNYPASFTYTVGDEPAYFVAVLDYLQAVSVTANPTNAGYVSGDGYYDIGQQVTISAEAISPYVFDYWTINGYQLNEAQSFVYTVGDSSVYIVANFINKDGFNPPTPAEPIVYERISAIPPENYYFVSWNDGNTDNPRMVPADKKDDYSPVFAPIDFVITSQATICGNEYYQLGDNRLTIPGVYRATLTSSLGSDSVVILQLTVNPSYFFSSVDSIINSGEVQFMDTVLRTEGIYLRKFKTVLGCDSVYQKQIVFIGKEPSSPTDQPGDSGSGDPTKPDQPSDPNLPDEPDDQAIEQTRQEPIANSQKLFKNGQFLILRGDRIYTIDGQEIR